MAGFFFFLPLMLRECKRCRSEKKCAPSKRKRKSKHEGIQEGFSPPPPPQVNVTEKCEKRFRLFRCLYAYNMLIIKKMAIEKRLERAIIICDKVFVCVAFYSPTFVHRHPAYSILHGAHSAHSCNQIIN